MIVLSNTNPVTLAPGQSMTFDAIPRLISGNGECFSALSSSVKLRQAGIYEINYGANVSGATAGTPVQLSIQLGGYTIPETTAIYTPATADAVGNISREIKIRNCCGDLSRVTLVNTSTTETITVAANAVLSVKRLS